MSVRRGLVALPLLGMAACGGPTGPDDVVPVHTVTVTVFYDEDADGVADPGERGRVPGVEVVVASRSGVSTPGTGRAVIVGVREGVHVATARSATLPAFYAAVPGLAVSVRSPATEEVFLPLTVPIGANRPHTYMGFGDSITVGEGSTDGTGYRSVLEAQLEAHFGVATVVDEGISGTRSSRGAARIAASLDRQRPAYTLVHYGTNDWNDAACDSDATCFTIDSLRHIVQESKAAQSLPVLATIIPVNVDFDARVPVSRQEWVARMNERVRLLAREEGALLVDLHAAFLRAGGQDLGTLFADHVHPNDRGYGIMAAEFFRALSQPFPAATGGTALLRVPAAAPPRGGP